MIRIGVDFGGTKIEAAALDGEGRFLARVRAPNPGRYDDALRTVRALVLQAERLAAAPPGPIGVCGPGSTSPASGLIRNANSIYLNGRPFVGDLENVLGRQVRLANDADCLAVSEAVDGAGRDVVSTFAAILGTGCGGGLVINGGLQQGRNGFAGEWGHTPLPWAIGEEHPGPLCWCGRRGCLELWISGTGFARDHGGAANGETVARAAAAGDSRAQAALDRYVDRLARGLAVVCDIVDPDVIVLGGGMSNVPSLYERLPALIAGHVFSDVFETPVLQAVHGDSSGVRGAARLWPETEAP